MFGPDEDPHRHVEATGGALGPLETGVDILGYQPTPPGSDRMEIVAMDGLAGYKTGAPAVRLPYGHAPAL